MDRFKNSLGVANGNGGFKDEELSKVVSKGLNFKQIGGVSMCCDGEGWERNLLMGNQESSFKM